MKNLILSLILVIIQVHVQAQTNCTFNNNVELKALPIMEAPPFPLKPILEKLTPTLDPPDTINERLILWLPGLGGDVHSWDPAKNASTAGYLDFKACKVANYVSDYTAGNNTMWDCGFNALTDLKNASASRDQTEEQISNNLVIAHSQGGIVARTMQWNAENSSSHQLFGGFVTFVTSNDGAEILRNARSIQQGGTGLGKIFVRNTCANLGPAIISANLDGNNSLKRLIVYKALEALVDIICEKGDFIWQNLIDKIANQTQTNDYLPGAPFLQNMKNYEVDPDKKFKVNRVAFASEEPDSFLIWRTLHYFREPSVTHMPFTANADYGPNTMKYTVDSIQRVFFEKRDAMQGRLDRADEWDYILRRSMLEDLRTEVKALSNGIEFFNTADDSYKVIIGALTYKDACKVTLFQEDEYGNNACSEDFIFNEITDANTCVQKAERLYDEWAGTSLGCSYGLVTGWGTDLIRGTAIRKKSDGVVLYDSQSALPGNTVPLQKLFNSSHMQVRNDRNTKLGLNAIYDGTLNRGDNPTEEIDNSIKWFYTAKR